MTAFDEKYRPRNLDKIIGHEKVVTRMKGIIASKKYPNAMLLVGPSSAGKTTIARAFVASLFGVDYIDGKNNVDYAEINLSDKRGIDDVREVLKVATYKPRVAPRRVILLDEAQGLGAATPAANAILKPLENPPPHTLWILGSMEPEKLGQALKNRCSQFVLSSQDKPNITKFIKRIAKGEEMDYMTDELYSKVAEASNGEMRSAAKIMEAVYQYVAGTGSKKVKASDIEEALNTIEGVDDELAVKILVSIYANKFSAIQKSLLDVQDGFKLIGRLLQLNSFLMNQSVLKGVSHKAVWWSQQNKDTLAGIKEFGKIDLDKPLPAFAMVQQHLLNLRMQSGAFMVGEAALISAHCFAAIQQLKPLYKGKE